MIRVWPFDLYNPYEGFHAYLNVAMIMSMFQIKDPQIVLISQGNYDEVPTKVEEVPRNAMEMWRSFSSREPIYYSYYEDGSKSKSPPPSGTNSSRKTYIFHELIDTPFSGTSMLVTKSRTGGLQGRGADHHCKSSLYRDIVKWMASNFGILVKEEQHKQQHSNETIQVVWSSRQPYNREYNKTYVPNRAIVNEEELVGRVEERLGGHDKYNITIVDFGKMSTRESIRIAANSDIMVGVHGCGLIWSSFLPRHGGLVEIFGATEDPATVTTTMLRVWPTSTTGRRTSRGNDPPCFSGTTKT